ncbi:RAD52 motif-containing protein 1 isoform X2 [Chiloscyllium plagiosum]|uniref:RAD52 motif-containing protein 1 isoform X1 n=1 Tax=Chiloscyllium plagiosum TaxID=36176 RepID=UPI001CB7F577|nr:RAD52 motif-containing protein 1 isoform X1 [Chiloscyllium plagiosum]XP_043531191.1 RAD52 motif-containing protein 1 isoform X2 [Chiloscyllium plagiosum]
MAAFGGSPAQAEIVDFKIPTANNKTLFVCNILPRESEAEIYDCIFRAFSDFGLLYSVRVCRNAAVAEPGYYAIVKFYSAFSAAKAQSDSNKKCLFQRIPLKVQMCTKRQSMKTSQENQLPLNSIKCQELANYYLGFNGWCSRIIALQNISNSDGCEENTQELVQLERKSIKYICMMEIKLINYGMCCQGIGISEEFDQDVTDPLNFTLKIGRAQKAATQKALSDAFQKIFIVVLGNGKVSLQWSSQHNETDCFTEDELQTQLQVNDISRSQFEHEGQEEILSDLSYTTESMEGTET